MDTCFQKGLLKIETFRKSNAKIMQAHWLHQRAPAASPKQMNLHLCDCYRSWVSKSVDIKNTLQQSL